MISKQNSFDLGLKWQFPEARRYTFVFISLFFVLILIYSNSFQSSFHFDDTPNILENPNVQPGSLSWDELKKSFYGVHLEHNKIKRPLSYLSLALNYYFSGENVYWYHVVNFTIHFIAAVFLFLLVYNTLKLPLLRERYKNSAYPIALLSAFLWATHPIQLTAVTYIVQRMAGMAGLFYVMAMYLYLKARTSDRNGKRLVLFSLCGVAGLLAFSSKENAAMLPVSLFLFDLFLIQGMSKENLKKAAGFAVIPVLIFAVLALFYVDFTSFLEGYESRPFSLYERLLTEPRVLFLYISLLLYPTGSRLALIHDINISYSLVDPWSTVVCLVLVLSAVMAALYVSKQRPLISFCVVFFFLNHLIEGSIFPLELVYEHRNYIPSMFFLVLAAVIMVSVLDYFSYRTSIQFVMAFAFSFLLAAQAHTTYERNNIWKNNLSLWWDNAQKAPDLSRVHTNLGKAYDEAGIKVEAEKYFRKALGMKRVMREKGLSVLYHNVGLASFHEGKHDAALRYFRKALEINPASEKSLTLLCQLLLEKGRLQRADYQLRNRVKDLSKVRSAPLLKTYALVMYHLGRMEDAIDLARKALKRDPDHSAAVQILAQSFRAKGQTGKAKRYWLQYLKRTRERIEPRLALIELYAETKDNERLGEIVKRLLCLSGDRDLCKVITRTYDRSNMLKVYYPDTELIQEAIKTVLTQKGKSVLNCGKERAKTERQSSGLPSSAGRPLRR